MSLHEFLFGFDAAAKAKFPWLFDQKPVDRRNATRKVEMEVLSLGMGRTGTASMQKALQILGMPTYHGFDAFFVNKPDLQLWKKAFDMKYRQPSSPSPQDWRTFFDALLGHVAATTDMPTNVFGPELIAAYPEAKIILVERDIESWYKSWERAVVQGLETPGLDLLAWFDAGLADAFAVAREGVMREQFHAATTTEYRKNARPTYRAHYAEIRSTLASQPDRLLEYRLGSGWEPLCEFLGKPVPDLPFPMVNEGAAHDEMGGLVKVQMARTGMWYLCVMVVPVVVAGWGMWWGMMR